MRPRKVCFSKTQWRVVIRKNGKEIRGKKRNGKKWETSKSKFQHGICDSTLRPKQSLNGSLSSKPSKPKGAEVSPQGSGSSHVSGVSHQPPGTETITQHFLKTKRQPWWSLNRFRVIIYSPKNKVMLPQWLDTKDLKFQQYCPCTPHLWIPYDTSSTDEIPFLFFTYPDMVDKAGDSCP